MNYLIYDHDAAYECGINCHSAWHVKNVLKIDYLWHKLISEDNNIFGRIKIIFAVDELPAVLPHYMNVFNYKKLGVNE